MVDDTLITMCVFNRPHYTLQVVGSLLRARGIRNYPILVSADRSVATDKVLACLEHLNNAGLHVELRVCETRIGCNRNNFDALDWGFSCCRRVIHIEDDTIVAPDFFEWAEFCFDKFEHDPSVYSWSGYSRHVKTIDDLSEDKTRAYVRGNHFVCWGWGSWRDRWESTKAGWAKEDVIDGVKTAWDTVLEKQLAGSKQHLFPYVSRVKNIGEARGMFNPSREWHKHNVALSLWSGDLEQDNSDWHEHV